MTTHGLVLGKFYPPHAGHHHLIRAAAAGCDRLTVLVCAASVESIPLADRMAWLREEHPGVAVVGAVDDVAMDVTDPAVWDAHMAIFTAAVSGPVDVVFTSEGYGPELARRFGARHVAVDSDRARYPVSGTAVRADPPACWEHLSGPVRAGLAKRVVVLGAESTGTTTLARQLAEHYRQRGGVWAETCWVPEYGREYSAAKLAALREQRPDATWSDVGFDSAEFPYIARRQNEAEEGAARRGSPVLFCDTDSFATTVWHERYLPGRNPDIETVADEVRHHLWLLTDHNGVEFEDDGLRDGAELRDWMTGRFSEELKRTGRPFLLVTGTPKQRLATAVTAVDALLAAGWDLADPLPERRLRGRGHSRPRYAPRTGCALERPAANPRCRYG